MPVAIRFGLVRLMEPSRVPVPQRFTPEQRRIYALLKKQPRTDYVSGEQACNASDGGRSFRDTGTGNPEIDDAARAAGTLGDRPLIVLSGGREIVNPANEEERQVAEFRHVWINDLQASLARLSTRGKHIVVPHAGHMIGYDDPDAVVSAVREVVGDVRGQK